jgi:hypothetical protein
MDISVYADYTNISVRSGSTDIAGRNLNSAIGLSEPWFRNWRIRINTKEEELHIFPNFFAIIPAVRFR